MKTARGGKRAGAGRKLIPIPDWVFEAVPRWRAGRMHWSTIVKLLAERGIKVSDRTLRDAWEQYTESPWTLDLASEESAPKTAGEINPSPLPSVEAILAPVAPELSHEPVASAPKESRFSRMLREKCDRVSCCQLHTVNPIFKMTCCGRHSS